MKVRYQYRIYPTKGQQNSLAKLFGCCRVVWNDALALCREAEGFIKPSALQNICITRAKRSTQRAWLAEVSNIPLQQSINDLGVAFKNFFDSCSGKRKGKKSKYPRFKKKNNRQSARFRQGGFSIKNGKVYLAKIGNLKVKWSRPLPSEPSSITVIKDRVGHYYLSCVVEIQPVQLLADNQSVGVDLGLKTFAALSTGEKVNAPSYAKLTRKIKREQRKLSRRVKGSKRCERARLRVAKLKAKVRNIRKDFLHKLSTRLVRGNSVVCLEDLNVSGMVRNRRLSRAISEAGWGEFRTMCEAKSTLIENRQTAVISRWEPTSQICADCGYSWGKLDLSVREITCLGCGAVQCRDTNASRNIESSGLELAHDANRTGSECKTPLGAVRGELSTHQEAV